VPLISTWIALRDLNNIFYDRYFRPILNFLRTREIVLDHGTSPDGVRLEAEYFMVSTLLLDCLLFDRKKVLT
jgi:hypothetical protein